MNSVVLAVSLMLGLTVCRVNVVIALVFSALVAGLNSGLDINQTIAIFNKGLGSSAQIALSYATLGAFAVALSHSGVTTVISNAIIHRLSIQNQNHAHMWIKYALVGAILVMSICSQNLIPVHVAFIPILIPPLLMGMNMLNLDRRAIACTMTFGLVTTYTIVPVGWCFIPEEILGKQLRLNGLNVTRLDPASDGIACAGYAHRATFCTLSLTAAQTISNTNASVRGCIPKIKTLHTQCTARHFSHSNDANHV